MGIEYKINNATEAIILKHLKQCDDQFLPKLSTRVSLEAYANKIADKAILFEAWANLELIGIVAMYINEKNNGYITNVSVYHEYVGKGIAKQIFTNLIMYSKINRISEIKLEVSINNLAAIRLYKNFGFETMEEKNNQIKMIKKEI
jgi:ribosomal protein S18 acetylase RimI-like enzyme